MSNKEIEDTIQRDYLTARDEGRRDDQLRMLQEALRRAEAGTPIPGMSEFIAMFDWGLLIENYAPARVAMAALRDEYTQRLLDGDDDFPSVNPYLKPSRFKVIADMNAQLGEPRATHALFAQMEACMPHAARHNAIFALPAIIAAGDYALAERYLPDPLARLDELNAMAAHLPLYPAPGQAPRLATDLFGVIGNVGMRIIALNGLGRCEEARTLREAALAGIASDEMRALAQRELEEPGAIVRIIVERQMATEAATDTATDAAAGES